jgi:hypothetical protein
MATDIRVGCAGWSLPTAIAAAVPAEGSHMQRDAPVFNSAENN